MAANEPGKNRLNIEDPAVVRDALMNKLREPDRPGDPMRGAAAAPNIGGRVTAALATPADDAAINQPISFGQPNNLQRAIFCRQFATLIEVGIPVLKALQMLAVRTSHRKLREAARATARGVEEGQAIHQAMTPYAKTFTPLVVDIVRIGEMGGILEPSLIRLAQIMESKARIKRKVIAASMYPAVAFCVAVGVILLIMLRAIPAFATVYAKNGKDLPGITQIVIGISDTLQHTWIALLLGIVLAAWGLRAWGGTPSGHRFFSWLGLRMPIMRSVTQKIAVARSTRTLGGLVSAGIPLIEALEITADTNENAIVADALRNVHDQVQRGERMTPPLAKANVFPPTVVDMIGIGEDTGTLDRMLEKVADIYDTEVDTTLSGLSSIIEPLLIIFLGGVVMFIALAVLLPYFKLAQVVGE